MKCPKCKGETHVIDARPAPGGATRRRRVCWKCFERFTTYEYLADAIAPHIREKLLKAIDKTLQREWESVVQNIRDRLKEMAK